MENYKKKLIELVSNLMLEYKDTPSVIPYTPSKTYIPDPDYNTLPRASAEEVGIKTSTLIRLIDRLEGDDAANVHSIVIAAEGKIILDASRPGFSSTMPHLAHSMSKTVTGILVMMLYDEGKISLDDKVTDFFPEFTPTDERFYAMTVGHLLDMSSGVKFGEVGVVSEVEWTRAFIESEMGFAPGEKFAYNSMNSYMLAHIADRIIKRDFGIDAESYLNERLFLPLDIPSPLWERSAEGVIKGGFGLYLSAHSFLKLGIMMCEGGRYRGKIILSREAVAMMVSPHSLTNPDTGDFNYGLHVWVGRDGDDFLFNGMFGQNVWVDPRHRLVVALNSGNNELFSKGAALSIIKRTLREEPLTHRARASMRDKRALAEREREFFSSRRWITPKKPLTGLAYLFGLRDKRPFDNAFTPLLGTYTLPTNNQGIFPAFVRIMQNNYQGGIKSISIERVGEHLRLTSHEATEAVTIDFGIYEPVLNVVDLSGEKYYVMALASAVEDERGDIVYKFELNMPELPNTRRITMSLSPLGRLRIGMREIPDERITSAFIEAIPTLSGKASFIVSLLERNLGKNFIESKISELFSPSFNAISTRAPDHDAAIMDEDALALEKINSSMLVRSLIYSFIGNEEKREGAGALGKLAGFFGKFF